MKNSNRIKPKLNNDVVKNTIPFYGMMGMTTRRAAKIKINCICSDFNCKYSSRVWALESEFEIVQKESVSSKKCPIHNTPLVSIGQCIEMPKAGSKERKKVIEYFSKISK